MEEDLIRLERYLVGCSESSHFRVTLTTDDLESIFQQSLPARAQTEPAWWEELTQTETYQQSSLAGWTVVLLPDRQSVEFHNRWYEARRYDLADKYAFIFAIPHRDDYRSDVIAERAPHGSYENRYLENLDDFSNSMREIVRRASAEALSEDGSYTVYKQPYEIGPAAETWPMVLNMLQQLGPVADVMGITAFTSGVLAGTARLVRKLHRRYLLSRGVNEYSLPKPIFTKPVLAAMCEDHIRMNFHPQAEILIDALSVDDPTLFASENHPGLREIYIIDCRVGRKTYTFHLNCYAEVQSFVLRQGRKTEILPNPNLFEVEPEQEA